METYKKRVPQLDDDLAKFDMSTNFINFTESKSVNIKHVIYRSITLFVSALGRSYGVRKHSSFEIIDELKRRKELSRKAAHMLSLAVAVACHIRLVHYSSKNRQDDDIYKEQEHWGKEKLRELTKIVNMHWLLKGLASAECLQLVLKMGTPIRNFDAVFINNQISFYVGLMVCLGMDKECIAYTEYYLNKLPTLNPYDYLGMVYASVSYQILNLKDKAVEFFGVLRKKLEKPYQAIDDSLDELQKEADSKSFHKKVESISKIYEAEAFLRKRDCFRAYEMTEEVLTNKAVLDSKMLVIASLRNIECKAVLWKCREALSSIRDLLRAHGFEKLKHWFNSAFVVTVIRCITYSLIRIGKKEQGLHWAKQGLYFVEINDLTSNFIQHFIKLIKYIKENDVSDIANKHYYGQK